MSVPVVVRGDNGEYMLLTCFGVHCCTGGDGGGDCVDDRCCNSWDGDVNGC